MPRGKKMQTPSKEPESSSMTHEEEEEMPHDISKLQEQVQQMSCSQKLAEAKINGMESKIKAVEAKKDEEVWPLIQKLQKILIQTILPEIQEEGKIILELGAIIETRTQ